jgi:hypothetical protein
MGAAEPGAPAAISATELLARVRVAVEDKLRSGAPLAPPQGMAPWEEGPGESWEVFPWRAPDPEAPVSARSFPIALNDLLDLPPARFLARCHQALLGRGPRPDEIECWTRRLSSGLPRPAVILSLRLSGEGRRARRPLPVRWGPLARYLGGAALPWLTRVRSRAFR